MTAQRSYSFSKTEAWLTLIAQGGILEYRAMPKRRTDSGYYNDFQALAAELESLDSDKSYTAHYITLNPPIEALLARSKNRISKFAKSTTSDADIERRNWILVDVDPRRPAGISSSAREHKASQATIKKIHKDLRALGWPDMVICDSGNGSHGLISVDLPNDEESTELVKSVLDKLADTYNDNVCEVDRSVFNAARITKAYGTMARKGDDTEDRPHRRSKIVHIPKNLKAVTKEQLVAYVGDAIQQPDAGGNQVGRTLRTLRSSKSFEPAGEFSLENFLDMHNIGYRPYKDKFKLADGCPWISDDSHKDTCVWRRSDGVLCFKCMGARCSGKSWSDFREHFEPGYKDQRNNKHVDDAPGKPEVVASKEEEKTEGNNAAYITKELNKEIALFVQGGGCRILRWVENEQGQKVVQFLRESAARSWYANRRWLDHKNNLRPVFQTWFTHHQRLTYTGLTFIPAAPGKTATFNPAWFNQWAGWSIEPKPSDCSLFWEHVLTNICGNSRDHFEWVKAWCANLVQHPETPSWTAIVLRGPQGTGKGIFAQAIGYLCGTAFAHIKSAEALTSRFNSVLENIIFAFVDEAFWAGNKQAESILKGLVTEYLLSIEKKGIDRYDVPNRLHLVVASNESWVVPAGPLERRFAVFDVNPSRREDHVYFEAVLEQLRNGGYAALLHELATYDLKTGPNPRKAPTTDALNEQKQLSADPVLSWWYWCLDRGALLTTDDGWSERVVIQDLYDDYVQYTRKGAVARPGHINSFSRAFRKLVPSCEKIRVRIENPDTQKMEKKNCYVLPSRKVCVAYLKKTHMMSIEEADDPDRKPARLDWEGRRTRKQHCYRRTPDPLATGGR